MGRPACESRWLAALAKPVATFCDWFGVACSSSRESHVQARGRRRHAAPRMLTWLAPAERGPTTFGMAGRASAGVDRRPSLTWDKLAGMPRTIEVYTAGAWLVGYLVDVFGPQKFARLYGSLPADLSHLTLTGSFEVSTER